MDKKQRELNCLEMVRKYVDTRMNDKTRRYFKSLFPIGKEASSSERPDFIVNDEECSYAIEHFMIDFCYDGPKNNQSQSRISQNNILGIYSKYHDSEVGTIKDCDIDNAARDIENEINRLTNISLSFDYNKFIKGLATVFDKHYNNIAIYRSNPLLTQEKIKTGFLIEFHRDTTLMKAEENGSIVQFKCGTKNFPITHDMLNIFKKAKELDFIILAQFNEGTATEAVGVSIFEPNNLKRSLEVQLIKAYDKVLYEKIPKEIKLNVEKENS